MRKSDRLVELLVRHLAEELRALGFKAKSHTLIKELDESSNFINVQKSQSSSPDTAVVTVNIGCVVKPIRRALLRERPVKHISDCDWQGRIGRYLRRDTWWTISDENDLAEAAKGILRVIKTFALPDLDKMSTVQGIRTALASEPLINFSVEVLDYFDVRPGAK